MRGGFHKTVNKGGFPRGTQTTEATLPPEGCLKYVTVTFTRDEVAPLVAYANNAKISLAEAVRRLVRAMP